MKNLNLFLVLCAVLPLAGQAIITANDSTAEGDPFEVNGFNWNYVYEHPDGSAVAVDDYWVLTARHVADYGGAGTLTIGTTEYYQQEIVFHASADLALIRYDKALPGHYQLYSGSLTGLNTLMVGYGNVGTITKTGPNYFFKDSGSGRGTERWGSNQITQMYNLDYDIDPTTAVLMTTNAGFIMKFDADGTEAGVGVYDSGGGTFVNDGGEWKLAGINTTRLTTDATQGYNYSFDVSVGAYSDWITQTIPEPGTAVLLAGVAAALGVIHRIRCRLC